MVCITNMNVALFAMWAAALLGHAAVAAARPEIQSSLGLETGVKPVYYQDSGRYAAAQFGVSATLSPSLTLGASGAVQQSEDVVEPFRRVVDVQDPSISLSLRPIALASVAGWSFTGGASIVPVMLSELSLYRTSQAAAGLSASIGRQSRWLGARVSPSLRYTAFELTRDPAGRSNSPLQGTLAAALTLFPKAPASLTASYTTIERQYFHGANRFFYSTNLEIAGRLAGRWSLGLGLITSDSQLADGKRRPVYIYKNDFSQLYVRADYSL